MAANQRPPSAAKRLLRGEVVDVGVRGVERQAARARGGVHQHQRVAGGPRDAAPSRRSRSRCAPRRPRRSPSAPASVGRVAGIGLDDHRVGQERRAGGDLGELRRELAVGQVVARARAPCRRRARPRARWCRRCRAAPRSRRAGRAAGPGPRARGRPGPSPASGGARCPSRRRRRGEAEHVEGDPALSVSHDASSVGQRVQQLARAALAVGRLVVAVEEGALLGEGQPRAGPSGLSSTVARETEIRVSSMCMSYE